MSKLKSSIKDYLPEEEPVSLCQALVPEKLFDAAKAQKNKDGLTWDELITACLKAYLAEPQKQKLTKK